MEPPAGPVICEHETDSGIEIYNMSNDNMLFVRVDIPHLKLQVKLMDLYY